MAVQFLLKIKLKRRNTIYHLQGCDCEANFSSTVSTEITLLLDAI